MKEVVVCSGREGMRQCRVIYEKQRGRERMRVVEEERGNKGVRVGKVKREGREEGREGGKERERGRCLI